MADPPGTRLAAAPAGAGRAGGSALVIALLTTSYPRFAGDHAGCFVQDRACALAARGHRVDVLAAGDDRPGSSATATVDDPIAVTRLGFGATGKKESRALFYGDGAPEALERGGPAIWLQAAVFSATLAAAVRQRVAGWDAIEAHWLLPCALVALAVAPRTSLRAYAHSADVALLERLPLGPTLARWLAARAQETAAELIFVSGDLRARFAALAGRPDGQPIGEVEHLVPPAAIFPPITAASRAQARQRLGIRGPTVIAVGRLVPIKRFEHLIAACAVLRASAAVAPHLIIIGDGPQRAALQTAAQRAGVSLDLPGWVAREQMATWLHAADVFAHTSTTLASGRTEGMPMAALEALAVGLPIVATDQAGLRELALRHRSIDLVRAADSAALAAGLARFCVKAP